MKCPALAKKLATILGAVGKVPKSGHNSFHKYDYVTENDLVYAVRDKLAEAGIFVFTSIEEQHVEMIKDEDKTTALTTVTTRHTFVDGDTGESFSVLSQGQGADVGDKGGYKAATGAMKYFLYKCFMIPTGDDPEADEKTDRRAAERGGHRGADASRAAVGEKPGAGASVPRMTSTVTEREQFEQGKWENVKIHFGTMYKGKKLGELDRTQLQGWIKWEPKPFQGKPISEDDRLLRIALDVAAVEIGQSGGRD